jgi:hypothetical protein
MTVLIGLGAMAIGIIMLYVNPLSVMIALPLIISGLALVATITAGGKKYHG